MRVSLLHTARAPCRYADVAGAAATTNRRYAFLEGSPQSRALGVFLELSI